MKRHNQSVQYPAVPNSPQWVPRFAPNQYPSVPIVEPVITQRQQCSSDFGVREGLAVTFGVGSIASAVIGALTGNFTSLGVLAVTLAGAGAASLMIDSESSLKLETNNGYSLQFDRRF